MEFINKMFEMGFKDAFFDELMLKASVWDIVFWVVMLLSALGIMVYKKLG